MGVLYLVPTPVGNLEDITLRALRILKEVALIAVEDTRNARKLLDHYEIRTPVISYHEHNKLERMNAIMDTLLTGDVALISDAGTPGISDPGYELVNFVIDAGIRVVPLPGATALIPALVASGLPTDAFLYLGFPPRKYQALRDFFRMVAEERPTLIFYESPQRLVETLHAALEVLGNRQAVVAREVSKYYEEFQREPLADLITFYTENSPRGEITLLIAGNAGVEAGEWSEDQVREAMHRLMDGGLKRGEAARQVAEQSGWDRRDIYSLDL